MSGDRACPGCQGSLATGAYCRAMDREWHVTCFNCKGCSKSLNGEPFFRQGDSPYCESCFSKTFGKQCEGCQNNILSGQAFLEIAGKSYHPECLKCSKCSKCLEEGTYFQTSKGFTCPPCQGIGPAETKKDFDALVSDFMAAVSKLNVALKAEAIDRIPDEAMACLLAVKALCNFMGDDSFSPDMGRTARQMVAASKVAQNASVAERSSVVATVRTNVLEFVVATKAGIEKYKEEQGLATTGQVQALPVAAPAPVAQLPHSVAEVSEPSPQGTAPPQGETAEVTKENSNSGTTGEAGREEGKDARTEEGTGNEGEDKGAQLIDMLSELAPGGPDDKTEDGGSVIKEKRLSHKEKAERRKSARIDAEEKSAELMRMLSGLADVETVSDSGLSDASSINASGKEKKSFEEKAQKRKSAMMDAEEKSAELMRMLDGLGGNGDKDGDEKNPKQNAADNVGEYDDMPRLVPLAVALPERSINRDLPLALGAWRGRNNSRTAMSVRLKSSMIGNMRDKKDGAPISPSMIVAPTSVLDIETESVSEMTITDVSDTSGEEATTPEDVNMESNSTGEKSSDRMSTASDPDVSRKGPRPTSMATRSGFQIAKSKMGDDARASTAVATSVLDPNSVLATQGHAAKYAFFQVKWNHSKKKNNWKKRYCVLESFVIFFFKGKDMKQCSGCVVIPGSSVTALTEDESGQPYALRVYDASTKDEYILSAETQNLRRDWLIALVPLTSESYVQLADPNKYVATKTHFSFKTGFKTVKRTETGTWKEVTSKDTKAAAAANAAAAEPANSSLGSSTTSVKPATPGARTTTRRITTSGREKRPILIHENGVITAAAVDKIISLLASEEEVDVDFMRTFLLTFRHYLSPVEVIQHLIARFNVVPPPDASIKQLTYVKEWGPVIQKHVANVVSNWIDTGWFDFHNDEEAAQHLVTFLELMRASGDMEQLTMLAAIEFNIMRKEEEFNNMRLPDEPPSSDKSLLDFDPVDIAQQITLMDAAAYVAIRPEEFVVQLWGKPDDFINEFFTLPLQHFVDSFNRTSRFVASTIVREHDYTKRLEILKSFILIAKELEKLGNYNSLMAVLGGLNVASVTRLKHTFNALAPKTLKSLRDMERIIDPANNSRAYRSAKLAAPCVPFCGIVIKDVTFLNDGNSKMTKEGLVNWDKLRRISEAIWNFTQFQSECRYPFTPDEEIQTALKGAPLLTEEETYQHSLTCEPRECIIMNGKMFVKPPRNEDDDEDIRSVKSSR